MKFWRFKNIEKLRFEHRYLFFWFSLKRRLKRKALYFVNVRQLQRVIFFSPSQYFSFINRSSQERWKRRNSNGSKQTKNKRTCKLLRITYLYHLHGFASPEPQKNPLEMCVPVSKTKIALEWWKFASVRCTTLWFVHTRSSCQTIQPRFSLGPEKERDGPVSCRSLRKNPGNRTKNGLVLQEARGLNSTRSRTLTWKQIGKKNLPNISFSEPHTTRASLFCT